MANYIFGVKDGIEIHSILRNFLLLITGRRAQECLRNSNACVYPCKNLHSYSSQVYSPKGPISFLLSFVPEERM